MTAQEKLSQIKARFVAAMSAPGRDRHAETAMAKLELLQALVEVFGADRGGEVFKESLRAAGLSDGE